jgi:hypothetical protein
MGPPGSDMLMDFKKNVRLFFQNNDGDWKNIIKLLYIFHSIKPTCPGNKENGTFTAKVRKSMCWRVRNNVY